MYANTYGSTTYQRPRLSGGPSLGLVGAVVPYALLAAFLYVTFTFASWTWGAAMLPIAASDVVLDGLLTSTYGAGSALWGAFALMAVPYLSFAAWRWVRARPLWDFRVAACVAGAYVAFVLGSGAVLGTHFPAQVAHAWSNPGRSATKAWNRPAQASDGKARPSADAVRPSTKA